jgi:hypothetical protein
MLATVVVGLCDLSGYLGDKPLGLYKFILLINVLFGQLGYDSYVIRNSSILCVQCAHTCHERCIRIG